MTTLSDTFVLFHRHSWTVLFLGPNLPLPEPSFPLPLVLVASSCFLSMPAPSFPCHPEFRILLFWNSSAVLCKGKESSSYQSSDQSGRLTSYFPWFLSSLRGQLDRHLAWCHQGLWLSYLIFCLHLVVVRMVGPREWGVGGV